MKYFTTLMLWGALFSCCSADDRPAKNARTPPPFEQTPRWSLRDSTGETLTNVQFEGKVLLFHFWATWNARSRDEIPDMADLQKKYSDVGLVVIGVALERREIQLAKHFADARGANYRIVLGNEALAEAFGINNNPPATVIINRQGHIVHRKNGYLPTQYLEQSVAQHLTHR